MKNLKRLMSVVLSVVMLMSFVISTSAATFTDVAETDKAYEAVEVLAALKILEGKEAGAFDPEANIKRSEFAAVVCRAMNQESAAIGAANFSDVPADHWAAGYIGWAASQKIVNGRGNGTFDPDANVSYNEAIAMIVRAMGYEWYVEEMLGGYPTGYARIAGSYKIDKDITSANGNAPATRADVATLVYNAFDAPLMDMSYSISTDAEYVIFNGSKNVDYEKRTLLSYYGDIYKIKATVEKTYRNDSNLIDAKGNKSMDLKIVSLYGFDEEWVGDALNKNKDALETGDPLKVIANNDAWAEYQGYTVNAYVTLNENDKLEAVAMVVDTRSAEELVIENARELIELSDDDGETVKFEYLEDADATRAKKVDIDSEYAVYVNNIAVTSGKATYFNALDDGDYASVTLLDSDGDGDYDKIYLVNYEYGIVEEVDTEMEIIETDATAYYLSADDTSDAFVYNIYKDGAAIGLEDLAEGDLLNVVIGDLDGVVEDATFVDIYVTNNVVESSVSSKSGDRYVIDGEDFYLADGAAISSLTPGDTGSFYITIDGYIYDADFTSTYSDNYAFIVDIAESTSGFGSVWEIKLLDKNNNLKVVPVKSTVYVTDASPKRSLKIEDTTTGQTPYFTALKDIIHGEAAVVTADANVKARMVTFKETNGEITELVFAKDSGATDRDFDVKALGVGGYSARQEVLGNWNLLETTVLFSVPTADSDLVITSSADSSKKMLNEDRIQVYAISALNEEDAYTGFAYNCDDDEGTIGAALLTNEMGFSGAADALAVVSSISEGLNAAGEMATIVEFWQAGERKTLAVSDNMVASGNIANFDSVGIGDVFQYTVDSNDEIAAADLIFDYNVVDNNGTPDDADDDIVYIGELKKTTGSGDITYAAGLVNTITAKRLALGGTGSYGASLAWDEVATNVQFDVARSSNPSNAFRAYTSTSYLKDARVDAGKIVGDYYIAVVRADERAVVDVVAYKYAKVDGGILESAVLAALK